VDFCLPHTRSCIESKISPTALYNIHHRQNPFKPILRQLITTVLWAGTFRCCMLLCVTSDHEDGGSKILRKVRYLLPDYTATNSRTKYESVLRSAVRSFFSTPVFPCNNLFANLHGHHLAYRFSAIPRDSMYHHLSQSLLRGLNPESQEHTLSGGGLEYLHSRPASRSRRRKGNPVPGGITGPHKYRNLVLQVGAGRKAMLCNKITDVKSRETKSRWSDVRQIWQNLLRKALAQKGLFYQ
jgi:hypothetical protein